MNSVPQRSSTAITILPRSRTTDMILPVHERLRAHVAHLLPSSTRSTRPTRRAIVARVPAEPRPRRSGHAGRLRAGAPAAQGAARHRAGDRRRARHASRASPRVEAAPNGYLNFFLERRGFLRGPAGARDAPAPALTTPARPSSSTRRSTRTRRRTSATCATAALGDTLVRVLRFRGVPVEVQNYIDDTGVQVADVVVGFRELEGKTLDEVRADRRRDAVRLLLLGPLRARHRVVRGGQGAARRSAPTTLHDIEHGGNETAEIAAFIADRIVRCHLKTMARMNVDYDLLTWEGDILRLQFWARAFEVLKAKGAVYLQTEGRLAGCWVMPIEEDRDASPRPKAQSQCRADEPDPESPADDEAEEREKVIVRSNGAVTYVGKDIAYQFWKFGLLGRTSTTASSQTRPDGPLWATCYDGRRERPSAVRRRGRTSTTSSTCGSRTCRSC